MDLSMQLAFLKMVYSDIPCDTSHQVMHIMSMFGAFSQITGLRKTLGYWRTI